MRYIYEHDMPDMPRWKPNGITDNRSEYVQKFRAIHNLKKDCPIGLDDAPDLCSAGYCSYCKKNEQRIAESHDITRSDFGFH